MPTRRRRQQGLERVLGTPALFATAYGNVGSSIYYALGVTAAFALGLTPLVFVVAGVIFVATSLTYTEGTVRYPEAGGSSSFARHAFNELVSFGAAWAQMLVSSLFPSAAADGRQEAGGPGGQAGEQRGHAGDVSVVLPGLIRAAQIDVLDLRRIDAGALDRSGDGDRGEVVGPDGRERAAVPAHRRSHRRDYDCSRHRSTLARFWRVAERARPEGIGL